jgi:hypothetical protein
MADPIQVTNSALQLDGKTLVTAEDYQAIGGQKTFERAPDPPFEVEVGSAKVAHLDADLLDGEEGSLYHDASNLDSGTVPSARFPAVLPAVSGENLTNLDAANLTGVIPGSAVPDPLPAVSGAALTSLPAANLTGSVPSDSLTSVPAASLTGTVADARFPATLPAVSGASLTHVSRLVGSAYSNAATSGTGETDLHQFTLAAGALNIGDCLIVRAWGDTDANTNNKTIKVYAGGLYLNLVAGASASQWYVEAVIIRTGEATAMIAGVRILNSATSVPTYVTGAVTWSGAVVIKTTGQNATSGLFTQRGMVVERVA